MSKQYLNILFKEKASGIDYFFWICFLLYFDPGGFFDFYFNQYIFRQISYNDLLFFLMFGTAIRINYGHYLNYIFRYERSFKFFLVFILIWIFYYIFIWGIVISDQLFNALPTILIKTRRNLYTYLLVLPVFVFSVRSLKVFFKLLFYTSFIVLILFFISILLNINLVPIYSYDRGFISGTRIFMYSYGLIFLTIYFASSLLILNIHIKRKQLFYITGLLMAVAWLVSITRNQIIGMIIVFISIFILKNLATGRHVFKGTIRFIAIGSVIIALLFILSPKYLNYSVSAIEETLYLAQHGESSEGKEDVRLNLQNEFLREIIRSNIVFGTGYSPNWFAGQDKARGYETQDYPFLASLAQYGIFGLIIFSYYYFFLLRFIIRFIKFAKTNSIVLLSKKFKHSVQLAVIFALLAYYIFLFFAYPLYFGVISSWRISFPLLFIPIIVAANARLKNLAYSYNSGKNENQPK